MESMRCRELRQRSSQESRCGRSLELASVRDRRARVAEFADSAPLAAPPIMSEIGPKSRPPLATELYAAGRLIGNKCFDENFEVCRAACAAHATLRSSGNCARGCAAHATLRRARHDAHTQAAQRIQLRQLRVKNCARCRTAHTPADAAHTRPLTHRARARSSSPARTRTRSRARAWRRARPSTSACTTCTRRSPRRRRRSSPRTPSASTAPTSGRRSARRRSAPSRRRTIARAEPCR